MRPVFPGFWGHDPGTNGTGVKLPRVMTWDGWDMGRMRRMGMGRMGSGNDSLGLSTFTLFSNIAPSPTRPTPVPRQSQALARWLRDFEITESDADVGDAESDGTSPVGRVAVKEKTLSV